jgi:hypothetical protein
MPEGEGEGEAAAAGAPEPVTEPDVREPARDPTPAPPRVVVPGSVPTPIRTVWEAFAPLDQEAAEDEADDDAA